ncbi:F420-dependent oxidoreductase [Nocardia sp. SYP-A9097]|uniref:Pr6Pr family membrane protein n=1 Tax=Nocardia sp. SYP-A9097 TaxID=2663237 RepID=UPI00129A577D|nr:Pr6Pr family membrane protein [Nocardia sp. SYP-A9097]MRH92098.1 F420-dependent oxidoreductase [Nocardia sp. SYP-A9097]
MKPYQARTWFALTAACVLVGVGMQVVLDWQNYMPVLADTGEAVEKFGGSPAGRALNLFAFFTVQSNLIVGCTSLLLAITPNRSSTVFAVFRLIGLVAITITGLVYHITLRGLVDLHGWELVADHLQHTVVPLAAVVGWLVFGPRGLTSARVVRLTILFPLAYLAFTLIRGPLASNWYPYPFTDVPTLGYLRVCLNTCAILLFFIALAAGATWLDKRLPGRQPVSQSVAARNT